MEQSYGLKGACILTIIVFNALRTRSLAFLSTPIDTIRLYHSVRENHAAIWKIVSPS